MSESEIHRFPIFSYVGVRDPPPPSPSSSIHPHYLTPSHFFIHPFVIIMYPFFHPSIRHHYVLTSSSIHFSSIRHHHVGLNVERGLIPSPVRPNAGRENYPGPGQAERGPHHRAKSAPSQSPGGQNRSLWRENHPGPGQPEHRALSQSQARARST
jgi:hypothetical protein